jgi:hypothetical protein
MPGTEYFMKVPDEVDVFRESTEYGVEEFHSP